ncbi:MAG: AAA family ATPase, partial [Lachnospiraceae bacterium]|nr:AAA family ATPase [Lachnospiraceae bacterium]
MDLIIILLLVAFVVSPLIRCFVLNLPRSPFYMLADMVSYVIHRKWKKFNEYGIHMYIGMFGHGKTLSMTHRARKLYKRFKNTILFVSNYSLFDIPYVPLENFNQLMELGEEKPEHYSYREYMSGIVPSWYYDDDGNILPEYIDYEKRYYGEDENEYILVKMIKRWHYQATVVLIDEIQSLLSHRNFANFPLELLNVLTQQRKKRVFIMCSAQRYFMVDKIFRGITT